MVNVTAGDTTVGSTPIIDGNTPRGNLDHFRRSRGPVQCGILTWADLDLSIKQFLVFRRKMYEKLTRPMQHGQTILTVLSRELESRYDLELGFWDRMRYLIHSMPKPREFSSKYQARRSLWKEKPAKGWSYDTCQLCWRTVPYNELIKSKNGVFCFLHDLDSGDPTYRKHKRLLDAVQKHYSQVLKPLKECFPSGMPEEKVRPEIMRVLTPVDTPLPNLAEHLAQVGHDETPEGLLRIFHGPLPGSLPDYYKKAMEEFFQWAMGFPLSFHSG